MHSASRAGRKSPPLLLDASWIFGCQSFAHHEQRRDAADLDGLRSTPTIVRPPAQGARLPLPGLIRKALLASQTIQKERSLDFLWADEIARTEDPSDSARADYVLRTGNRRTSIGARLRWGQQPTERTFPLTLDARG